MVGSNACYGCGKSRHIIRDSPDVKNHAKVDTQPQPNPTAAANPNKRNMFYALKGRDEQEKSADVVTSNLHIFSFQLYALIDQGSTLFFVTSLVTYKFYLLT